MVRTIGTYTHTITYDYDGAGHLYTIHYPSGRAIRYGYDALGRRNYVDLVRTATASGEPIVSGTEYLPFGPLKAIYNGNNLRWDSNWDANYRLIAMAVMPNDGIGTFLTDRYVGYQDGLNLSDINNSNLDPAQTQGFGYDDAGRLLTANGPYGSRSYSYDKVGNRLSEAKTVTGTTTSQTYTYPTGSNRLSSVTQGGSAVRSFLYDAAGNQTSDTRGSTATTYTISNAGRISQASVGGSVKANYTYDGLNRLSIRQTLNTTPSGTTHLIHDAWDRVIVETNGAGQAVSKLTMSRLYSTEEP